MAVDNASPEQRVLFERFRTGQAHGLALLLACERPLLFDYLLRMTADVKQSLRVIDEVELVMQVRSERGHSLTEFRVEVFRHARTLSAHSFQEDVSLLENATLRALLDDPELVGQVRKRAAAFARLDRAIGKCEPLSREAIILHLRCRFDLATSAALLDLDEAEVAALLEKAYQGLREQVARLPRDPREVIGRLALHPIPERCKTAVTDLHELIGDLDRANTHIVRTSFYVILALVFGGVAVFLALLYLAPDWFPGVTSSLRQVVRTVIIYRNL